MKIFKTGPGIGFLDSRYVNVTGDTMTGGLTIGSELSKQCLRVFTKDGVATKSIFTPSVEDGYGMVIGPYGLDVASVDANGDFVAWTGGLYLNYWSAGVIDIGYGGGDVYLASGGGYVNIGATGLEAILDTTGITTVAKHFTFPNAEGTFALLEVANVFTTNQKINCNSTTALLVEQDGVKDNILVVDTTNGNVQISNRVYIPGISGVLGQGYYTGTTSTMLGGLQSIDLGGKTYTFFSVNKYYTGGAFADSGQGRVGSSFQLTDNMFGFYSFDTGINYIQRMGINNSGDFGAGGTITHNISLLGANLFVLNTGNVGIGTIVPGARLHINGTVDEQQLIVEAHSTQTNNISEIHNSSGTVLSGFDTQGRIFSYGGGGVTTNFFATSAGNLTTTGGDNIGIGRTAIDAVTDGTYNIAIGYNALGTLASGVSNVAVGGMTLQKANNVSDNVAVGYSAAEECTGGSYNMAIGRGALKKVAGGSYNVAVGFQALYSTANVNNNVGIGSNAGISNTSGVSNIFIGYYAGAWQTTTSNLIIFDNQLRASTAVELTNAILYGVMATTPNAQTLRINAVTNVTENFKIGCGTAGIDYTLTFDGESGDGIITWMEDEDYFQFEDDVNLNAGEVLKVAGTQVIGARVVDERANDITEAAFDALYPLTAGLIDALRDAMISHGLISAS